MKTMSLPEFTYHLVGFVGFLTGAIVCVLATKAYQKTRKRSLLLIAIAAGVGAVIDVIPELRSGGSSWGVWYFEMALRVADAIVWLVGCWLLLRHYTDLIVLIAQRGAPPNGGPVTASDESEATEGPPSMS